MKGLYQGRYLIAVYDKNDQLAYVANLPSDCSKNWKNILRGRIRRQHESIHLIDCLEQHEDVFTEEDKDFLKFIERTRKKTVVEKAQELGISERTYYRWRKNKKLKNYLMDIDNVIESKGRKN